jgi:hypothetical protein
MKKQAGLVAVAIAAFVGGAATVGLMPRVYAQETDVKKPKWQYGLSLMVRTADEKNFGKDTQKYGIEVFKDENNGNIIYVSEAGSIAVLPAK